MNTMKPIALTFVLVLLEASALAQTQDPTAPAAPAAPAAAAEPAQAASNFTPEQLEQIVAPIALHPDSLLAMILMASTYPLEIVEAARWMEKNPSLKGKQLEEELKKQDWDPSVKSMCGFPTVLKQMNDNLDWTQDLGDAFLGQKKELMDTVQKMRRKAMEAGTLKTTEQQKVTDQDKVIVIQSTSPEVIYVPTYSPTVVYGSSWSYPTYYYPPMYAPYPPGAPLFAFGIGVAWGAAVWGNCNWGGSDVDIDINRENNFNRNTNVNPNRTDRAGGGKQSFQHDPAHRKGANYRNPQTAQKYGAKSGTSRVTRDQARGYSGNSGRGGAGASARPTTRPSGGTSSAGSGGIRNTRPSTSPSASTRPRNTTGGGGSGLSGSRSPGMDRSASTRGAASRGSGGARSGGGGSRGGGSGRGGGGGRRR
jgi:hypothetical protein